MAKKNCGCGQDPCVTFGAEEMHGDDRLDRWVENNYGEEYDWVLLSEFDSDSEDAYDILEDFIVLDDEGNESQGIAIVYRENFEAPYAGSGSLFSVGSSDALSGLSSKELTESSAIHGDFDSASLNYSGHQNLQVRAEDEDRKLVGWNIYLFYEDKDGNESKEAWNISDYIAQQIDEDFNYLMEDFEAEEYETEGARCMRRLDEMIDSMQEYADEYLARHPVDGNSTQYPDMKVVLPSDDHHDYTEVADGMVKDTTDAQQMAAEIVLRAMDLRDMADDLGSNIEYQAETFESMSWYDPGEDTNNLERAFRREYPRYTLDSSSMEYLIYQGGASNKFHIFFVAVDDGGQYHAFNAYGRIGYNPRIQYIGGPYSTFDSAEYAFKKKMGQKTKKGYRPFGAEGSGSISAYTTIPYSWETDPDPHEHDEHIDNYDIENAIEYEVDSEVRSGNRSGSGTYTTTVGYDDPEDEGSWVQEDLDIDYRWGAEGSEDDIPQVELHNPIETGIKLSIGSMIAVVGLSAVGGAVLGLLNRTVGDE